MRTFNIADNIIVDCRQCRTNSIDNNLHVVDCSIAGNLSTKIYAEPIVQVKYQLDAIHVRLGL
jgi:hypothetical protein